MQFVQTGMLGALAALAIPVIVHLLFRKRPRVVELGTLQFLRVVLGEGAQRRRLKRWALLALRLACVALVALLFARPYLLATESAATDGLVVVLVDRSASMGLADRGGSRPIDRAVAGARGVARAAGPRAQVELAAFDAAVRPLKGVDDLRGEAAAPSAAGTDYAAAIAWARDRCVGSRKPSKQVHIFTDLQRSGLGRDGATAMPPGVEVRLVDVGRAFATNLAVTALAISPATLRPGGTASVAATVLNASPSPLAGVPVRLHLESGGAARDLEQAIAIDGGATAAVAFELPGLAEGLWRGSVEVAAEGDALAFDDRRYLALAVAPPVPVWVVDGDPGRSAFESETYFLETALRLAPRGEQSEKSPFDVRPVDRASLPVRPESGPAGGGAVVLANVGGLDEAEVRRLSAFVEAGGGLLVFTGDRVDAGVARGLDAAGLGVGAVEGPAPAPDLPWRLLRWEPGHPVFRPFADPEHGDLQRPAFATITRIRPGPAARVLATFRGGAPALLERSQGRGKVLWFASACDRDWGDWPRGRMYVPMVHRMVGYVSGLVDGGRVRQASAGDGRTPGVAEADGVIRVVNPDPLESDTARCTAEEFARRFGFRPAPPERPAAPRAPAIADNRLRPDELWPWLAAALVGVLLLESFLANRTAA